MPQATQKLAPRRPSRAKKAADTIRTLRFMWRQARKLPKELDKTRLQPAPQTVLDAYSANKNMIEAIYGSDHIRRGLLYHGTGALQYDGDKYGAGMSDRLRQPLDTILKEGIRPHADPWALTEGSMLSVSFATVWPYARFYAEAHQTPEDPLVWKYGTRSGWFSYCIVGTARQSFEIALLTSNIRGLGQPKQVSLTNNGYGRLQRWALDIRRDVTPLTPILDVVCGQTDIPGNFSAIITISENDVPLTPMGWGGTYEKRAARPIRPSEFTSLAVPLNKVQEYTTKVHNLGYAFPVLPIEAVEYHMSRFPIQELAHAQRVKKNSSTPG